MSFDNTVGIRPGDRSRPATRALDRLTRSFLAPEDSASLVVFRIGFGLIMAWWCFDELRTGRVHDLYTAPRFHFTYYLFDFVRPWSGAGMTLHFAALLVLAVCIAAGLLYRVTTVLFALGFTYFFLLDRTNYQNHYYLLMLISWALVLLPLSRCVSLDALAGLAKRSSTVPAWCLWLVRFHIALPYFFGGVAKLNPDWFAGEPLRTHLLSLTWPPVMRPLLTSEPIIGILIWGGLLFDVAIVPLLLWRPTRILAYVLCVGFHLTNSLLFNIHVFPWFMIFATTVFFQPDWPRRWLNVDRPVIRPPGVPIWPTQPRHSHLTGMLIAVYCVVQIALPFRHYFFQGDSMWTEQGHHFSWRMMLRTKDSAVRYYLTDPETGVTGSADVRRFINPEQLSKSSRDPEMILHLAHYLAAEYRQATGRDAEVRALVLTTLNGRKPELLIDPGVDLAKEPRGFHERPWIMPQREPLRKVAWSVPMQEWDKYVQIPRLSFLENSLTPVISSVPQSQSADQSL